MTVPCFVCGSPMAPFIGHVMECAACEVTEAPLPADYICMTRAVTYYTDSASGTETAYIDHSAEHWPSPA